MSARTGLVKTMPEALSLSQVTLEDRSTAGYTSSGPPARLNLEQLIS